MSCEPPGLWHDGRHGKCFNNPQPYEHAAVSFDPRMITVARYLRGGTGPTGVWIIDMTELRVAQTCSRQRRAWRADAAPVPRRLGRGLPRRRLGVRRRLDA